MRKKYNLQLIANTMIMLKPNHSVSIMLQEASKMLYFAK